MTGRCVRLFVNKMAVAVELNAIVVSSYERQYSAKYHPRHYEQIQALRNKILCIIDKIDKP